MSNARRNARSNARQMLDAMQNRTEENRRLRTEASHPPESRSPQATRTRSEAK